MSLILSIEGNIGAGKSTLLEQAKKYIPSRIGKKIIFLQEPVDLWDDIKDSDGETILTKFYRNSSKYAFAFQMMAYISRLEILKNTVRRNPNSIIVCERSIWTDKNIFAQMLADDDKIEEIELLIYNKWFDSLSKEFSLDASIYLKTSPEVCDTRVKKRNRVGENIPLAYLQRCHSYHEEWLSNIPDKIVLDGDKGGIEITADRVSKIIDFINEQYDKKNPPSEFDIDNLHETIHC